MLHICATTALVVYTRRQYVKRQLTPSWPPQVLANELKEMCRKHNPASRHRRIVHGMGAVETDEGFGTIVVPQVRIRPTVSRDWTEATPASGRRTKTRIRSVSAGTRQ